MAPAWVIGVDAGGTKLLAGAVDEELRVGQRIRRVWRGGVVLDLIEALAEAVEEAGRAAGAAPRAVGFGIPSLMDFDHGVSLSSVHLPLDDFAFREEMRERLDLPVYVDNDANLAGLAEHRLGAARGARHAIVLTLGTGVGGALLLDGQLYRGRDGAAGELGHVTVDLEGPPCQGSCPNRGCLEVMVSGPAIAREGARAAEADPRSGLAAARERGEEISGELVTEMALQGDGAAREVIELVGRRLGAGLVGIVNAFNPEVVVVGGGVSRAGELLLEPARRVVAERALPGSRARVRIVLAHFGEEAGMVGAALFALDEVGR